MSVVSEFKGIVVVDVGEFEGVVVMGVGEGLIVANVGLSCMCSEFVGVVGPQPQLYICGCGRWLRHDSHCVGVIGGHYITSPHNPLQTLPPSSSLNATPPTKPSATPPSSGSPPSPVSPGEVVETHFDDKTWPRTSPRQSLLTHNNLNSTRTSDLKVPSMFEGAPIPSEATERTEGQESEESDRITVVKQIPLHERDDISSNSSSDPLHRRNNIEITIGSSYLDDSSNPELSTEISSTHSAPILPEVKTQPSDQPPNSEIHAGLKKPTETISSNHLCANSDHVMRNNAASHVTSTDVDSQLIVKSNSGVKELRVRDRVSQDQPDLGGGFSSYIARMKVLGHRRASSAPIKNMPNSTPFVGQDLGTCGISVPCEGVVPIASRTNQLVNIYYCYSGHPCVSWLGDTLYYGHP